jgi:hypothetical protein
LPGCQAQQNLPAAPAFWPQLRALPQLQQKSAPEMIVLPGQAVHMHLRQALGVQPLGVQAPGVRAPGVRALLLLQAYPATGKTPSA